MDEKDGFQQLGVVLGRRLLHADRRCGLRDVEHLAGLARELAQQQRQLPSLPHACEFQHVSLDDEVDVVIEPACAGLASGSSQGRWEPAGGEAGDVLLARGRGQARVREQSGVAQQDFCEVLSGACDLALGEREYLDEVGAPGEGLCRRGKRRVAR